MSKKGLILIPAFGFSALIFFLYLRITRGIDLTDEMQYYGEMVGLIKTGRLFSGDLFLQQNIYILFYPLLILYHYNFESSGIVLFGRITFAFLGVLIFILTEFKSIKKSLPILAATFLAVNLGLLVGIHGIFAVSYNSMAAFFLIFFLMVFAHQGERVIGLIGIISALTIFAYPPLSIAMASLQIVRLILKRDFRNNIKFLFYYAATALVISVFFLCFAGPFQYLDAYRFSKGFGVASLFSANHQFFKLALLCVVFYLTYRLRDWLCKSAVSYLLNFCLVAGLIVISVKPEGLESRAHYLFACLVLVAYAHALKSFVISAEDLSELNWLLGGIVFFASVTAATSGNGIAASFAAFAIGLPFLLSFTSGLATTFAKKIPLLDRIIPIVLSALIAISQIFNNPYREVNVFNATETIESVPEFRFIKTSHERKKFIEDTRSALYPIISDRRTMIVGHFPGIYFSSGAVIESCMLYMHSLTSVETEGVLRNCLEKKVPEFIVNIFSESERLETPRIKRAVQDVFQLNEINCLVKFQIHDGSSTPKFNWSDYEVCHLVERLPAPPEQKLLHPD